MESLRRPIRIGTLELKNRVLLAPLAGVTDIPFRRVCQELGAGLTSVEMLSSVAVLRAARRTVAMMERHPDEPILGVQVTGTNAEDIGPAVRVLASGPFDLVDLNMGCPVRKIIAKGWGAALLCDPAGISNIVERARAETAGPLSVKIRLGFDRGAINVVDNASRIAAAGADLLTIHGRTRSEGYGDPVDVESIRAGVDAARAAAPGPIVTVGNGDVLDAERALHMRAATGCDAVMVSRGALGNPWIFGQILGHTEREPTIREWLAVVFRHIGYHADHHEDSRIAAILFRKHLLWYLHGFPGVKRLRDQCGVISDLDEARRILEMYAGTLPDATLRYEDRTRGRAARRRRDHDPKYQMDRRLDTGIAS